MNYLDKFLNKVDGGILCLADKSVKAWNWTTGKTKADLSNLLLDSAVITNNVGMLMINNPLVLPLSLALFPLAHHIQKQNNKIEELEMSASENGLKNMTAEIYKQNERRAGGIFLGCSCASGSFSLTGAFIKDYDLCASQGLLSASWAAWGFAGYVMRTDYLPPQKNCLSRAKDKLTELIENYKTQPVPAPI